MRALTLVLVLSLIALSPAAAAAQATTADDAAALRKEIEQLQKQLESVTDRLKRLEAQPPAPSPGTAPPPSAGAPPPAAQQPAQQPGISALDIARPREPFGLYQQRGAGQLLFDIGIAGAFVAELTPRTVEKPGRASFPCPQNRFLPRGIEPGPLGPVH